MIGSSFPNYGGLVKSLTSRLLGPVTAVPAALVLGIALFFTSTPAQAAPWGTFFHNRINNKCLETGFYNVNGALAGMWDCWGGANQQWYWDGSQIRNRLNNKCLEILGLSNVNGALAGMWDCWGGANQQW